MDDSMEEFRSDFYIEAIEILEKANGDALKAEAASDSTDLMNGIFRGVHTVKGGAGMFEMIDVSNFAHEFEGILNLNRDGVLKLSSELMDIILSGIDHLIKMFQDYKAKRKADMNEKLIELFHKIIENPNDFASSVEVVEKAVDEVADATVEAKPAEQEIQTMRVDENKVENFTNIVGELLITRNTYEYLLIQMQNNESTQEENLKLLKENLHQFARLINDIHHGVISLRMVPVRNIFTKFNRIARDISRKQKKPIILLTEGDEIEIDKKIADILSDPLVHMVRNSCYHGIEMPDQRLKAGKPEQGKVVLKASQEGSMLLIRIIDDGKGINRQAVYEKAIKQGLETPDPDDDAILNMIFMPGFSTAQKITDVSGRGVGMDVVRSTIMSIGGDVEIKSEEGKGSEILLSIPMTMGINAALIVQILNESYAIPLDYILESVKINPSQIRRSTDNLLFYYRGEVVVLEFLHKILGNSVNFDKFLKNKKEISIIILQTRKGKFGVIVDFLNRNMEVAIKPLPDEFSEIKIISGVSIMGDGKVFLVLNPEEFF